MTESSEKNSLNTEPISTTTPLEEATLPLHESWKNQEEFEQYLADLSKWKETLLLEKIEADKPIDEELANYETILGAVGGKTAEYAREAGRDGRGEAYFRSRVSMFEQQLKMKSAASLSRDVVRTQSIVPQKPKRQKGLTSLDALGAVRDQIQTVSEGAHTETIDEAMVKGEDVPLDNTSTNMESLPSEDESVVVIRGPIAETGQDILQQETEEGDTPPEQKHVAPPSAIEEVSAEVTAKEIVDRVRGYFDVIARESENFQNAQYELFGDKKEFNGLRKGLTNLEARRVKLNESPESPQKEKGLQALNRDIVDVERRKSRAEEVFVKARDAMQKSMRETIAHLDLLPLILKEAICNAGENPAQYDAVFREYDISPIVASVVARALNKNKKTAVAPVLESEVVVAPPPNLSGIYEERDGHVFNAGTEDRVDMPPGAPEKDLTPTALGSNISNPAPIVMSAEDGVVTYDKSIRKELGKEIDYEHELLQKILDARNREVPTYPPVLIDENPALSTGIYDTEHLPDFVSKKDVVPIVSPPTISNEKIGESSGSEKVNFKKLSRDELKALYHGTDLEKKILANAEWERRAFEVARYNKVEGALQNTLAALREIKGGVAPEGWVSPPEKWLREFQEIPAVANYLELHPLPVDVDLIQQNETPRPRGEEKREQKLGVKMQAQLGEMAARAGVERFSNRQLEEMHLDDNAFAASKEDTTAEEEFEIEGEAYRARIRRAMELFAAMPVMTFDEFKNGISAGKKTTQRILDDLIAKQYIKKTGEESYAMVSTPALEITRDTLGEPMVLEKAESKEGLSLLGNADVGSPWDSVIKGQNSNDPGLIGYEAIIGRRPSFGEVTAMKKIVALLERTTDAVTREKIIDVKQELLDMMEKSRNPLLPAQIRWTTRKL